MADIIHTQLWGGPVMFDWHKPGAPLYREGSTNRFYCVRGPGSLTTYKTRSAALSDARYQRQAYAKYGETVSRDVFELVPGIGFVKLKPLQEN